VRLVHYHGGRQNAELREALKDWFIHVGVLHPVTPPMTTEPTLAEIAILLPRCEVAPVALARYLLSSVPFALLMPVDLLAMASHPNVFRQSPHTKAGCCPLRQGWEGDDSGDPDDLISWQHRRLPPHRDFCQLLADACPCHRLRIS
jgi:hypothetical protein